MRKGIALITLGVIGTVLTIYNNVRKDEKNIVCEYEHNCPTYYQDGSCDYHGLFRCSDGTWA